MDVKLPPLGEGADSGTVVNILVKEGDQISKGQTILELETGKAVTPIPSAAAGKVTRIHVAEGAKTSVGALLLSLEGSNTPAEDAPAAAPKSPGKKAPGKSTRSQEEESEESESAADDFDSESQFPPPASPSLRRLAQDLGIDLRKVRGSENGGRIVVADLKTYIGRLRKAASLAQRAGANAIAAKAPAESIDFSKFGPIAKRPMSGLRKIISQRMSENWNAIPHVTQFEEIDLTRVMDLRKKYADAYEQKGARLTVTSFALKAVAHTLKKHPLFNTSLDEAAAEIVYKEYFHIGLAVDSEQGLLVPVIRDVDKKDLVQLSRELAELALKARERKISTEEMQGGTFTISNQGGIGGGFFTPIVNKPEVAILGLGKGRFQAVVTSDKRIEPRLILPSALSYDHRVIDGGNAARFILDLMDAFQNFNEADVKI